MSKLLALTFLVSFLSRLHGVDPGVLIVFAATGMVLYFLPTLVAAARRSAEVLAIAAVNLLLGWTLAGWIAALVWAVRGQTEVEARSKAIEPERLAAALANAQFFEKNPIVEAPKKWPVEATGPGRYVPSVLFGAVTLVALVVGVRLIDRLTGGDPANGLTVRNAVATGPTSATRDELNERATFTDIVSACGQPELQWTTTVGSGRYQQNVEHLWYARVPAEVRLTVRPNESREESRHWIFAGAATAQNGTSAYSGEELKQRMPCVSPWADALTAEQTQQMKRSVD